VGTTNNPLLKCFIFVFPAFYALASSAPVP
jgi:hypothetical protein